MNGLVATLAALSAQLFLYISTTVFLRRSFGLRLPLRAALLAAYLVAMLIVAGVVGRHQAAIDWHGFFLRMGIYTALVGGLALFLTRADHSRLAELFREMSSRALAVVRT